MPPRQIPGFYYDEAKGKYFKIEARATAPPAAHWSSENVKKRARKDRDRERGERKRGRPTGSQPIRRSLAAPRRCFAGDELRLQCEGVLGLGGSRRILGDSRARVWAQGFGDAGSIQFWGYGALTSRVTDFTVVEGNVERLGYIYAAVQNYTGQILAGKYIPTDRRGRVIFDAQQTGFSNYPVDSQGEWRLLHDELSAVGYNPHKKVFFAACLPTQQGTRAPLLYIGGADPLRPGPTVRNRLHFDHGLTNLPTGPLSAPVETHTAVSAPRTSPSLCLLGTNCGAVLIHDSHTWDFLSSTQRHGDIFAIDSSHLEPDLVVSGSRKGIVCSTDIRSDRWATAFKHGTTVTHLRVAPDGNKHRVIVAGVNNTMAIYDRRWLGRGPNGLPVLSFPEYRNEARVKIGWDLCEETGVVVAAEGRGVGLYSVSTGARVGELPVGDRIEQGNPVRCLRVARTGKEAMPSVFVGIRGAVAKFSWGLEQDDDGKGE